MATCPNCTARVPATAAKCPSCGALFGAGRAWKPVTDSADTSRSTRSRDSRLTSAAAPGAAQKILAGIQQQLRDEKYNESTKGALRKFSDLISDLDTPFRKLISDSATRLTRLAEAPWEIDLLKDRLLVATRSPAYRIQPSQPKGE